MGLGETAVKFMRLDIYLLLVCIFIFMLVSWKKIGKGWLYFSTPAFIFGVAVLGIALFKRNKETIGMLMV